MTAQVIAVLAGAVLIIAILGDAIGTLIVTRGRTGRWRPTRIWYLLTWRMTSWTALRLSTRAGDFLLNVYPAVSLLGLLVLWLAVLVVGWALVYWGLAESIAGATDFPSLLYYAGVSIIAAQFAAASGAAVRALSLVETVTGLGTIALLISYLPALYGAYSHREAKLLTLDDPRGGRIIPLRMVALRARNGTIDDFYAFCGEWETWTAEVLESHVSYPMLALFRSQHLGQSWITALGVVVDAATLSCALIPGADTSAAYYLHRRGRRAVLDVAERLDVPRRSTTVTWLTRDNFEIPWRAFADLGLPLYEKDEAWARLQTMYLTYGPRLQDLIDHLLAPHGFWGHSAEATVEQEVARAEESARERDRRRGRRTT